MKRDQLEDKRLDVAANETKEAEELAALRKELAQLKDSTTTELGALHCPQRWNHRDWQGRICPHCGDAIPGGGMYTPETMAYYFPRGLPQEAPRDPETRYTETEAEVMREYEARQRDFQVAVTHVDDLRHDRGTLPLSTMVDGQKVDLSDNARRESFRITNAIPVAERRAEQLRQDAQDWLLEHSRLGRIRQVRGASAVAAAHEEWLATRPAASTPPSATPAPAPPSIGQRLGAALRGK